MLTPQRYLVIEKRPNEPNRYFGPFVSLTVAERFVNEKLPLETRSFIKPLLSREEVDGED